MINIRIKKYIRNTAYRDSRAIQRALRKSFKKNFPTGKKRFGNIEIEPDYEKAKLVVREHRR